MSMEGKTVMFKILVLAKKILANVSSLEYPISLLNSMNFLKLAAIVCMKIVYKFKFYVKPFDIDESFKS